MKRDDTRRVATEEIQKLLRELRASGAIPPCESSDRLVPGEGSPESGVAIVGEAPGQQEERLGRPFVGQAGRLLRSTLRDQGIDPNSVWITNVVKCRPTRLVGGRRVNRAPTTAEARLWEPWLMREMEIIRPKIILCLGNLAATTLVHKDFKMGTEHGLWFDGPYDSKVLATYHPAYVLRQVGPNATEVRKSFAEDIRKVAEKVRQIA